MELSLDEELLLEKRDFYLCEIKNLTLELVDNPVSEDITIIQNELNDAYSQLKSIEQQLSKMFSDNS